MTGRRKGIRGAALATALCALVAMISAVVVAQAHAAFGDSYGIAPVNVPGADPAPAFPGDSAFWAGTCDVASAPIGSVARGVGARTDEVWAPPPANSAGEGSPAPAPQTPDQCIDWGAIVTPGSAGPRLWRPGQAPSWRLAPVTQAGAHPDGSATFWFRRDASGLVDGTTDNIYVELPAGFVGDPRAVPKCTADQFAVRPLQCPPRTQVGVLHLFLTAPATSAFTYAGSVEEILPIYNLEPRKGRLAEFGIAYVSGEDATTSRIVARARTSGDFGVTTMVTQLPAALPVISSAVTLWGVPWAASHDMWRPRQAWRNPDPATGIGEIPPSGLPENTGDPADDNPRATYHPSWGPIKPFLSNPTECSGSELSTRLLTDAYERQGSLTPDGEPDLADPDWAGPYFSPAPAVTGCEKVPFDADIELAPSSSAADSPSGLSVDLTIPQNDDLPFAPPAIPPPPAEVPQEEVDQYVADAEAHWKSDAGLATSQLDRAVVTLPEGVSVNPSGAAGLEGCSDAQMGVTNAATRPMLFDNDDPFDGQGAECPAGSKIGTVVVDTVLDEPLTGDLVLGTPKSTDPQSGEMFRLFIVARAPDRGLVAKIAGSSVADPSTGQLTATFDKNPRIPFEHMRLELKGGPRGLLGTPQRCGTAAWVSSFSPWSAAHGAGGTPVADDGAFATDQNCAFGFSPTLDAGVDDRRGGKSGTFTFRLSRNDGEQWVRDVAAKVPAGLVASIKDVPLCTNRQATNNACPAASRIGSLAGSAGAGVPFVLEQPGAVYLTEGYKGGSWGLAVSIPVEAGPFRGALALSPILLRAALHVDPDTTRVTAVADPVPLIWHGIPLRARQATITLDRPGFMRNPTNCDRKQIEATVVSAEGAVARPTELFQATECRRLPYKPKLAIRLTGKKQTRTGAHPGVRAVLTQPRGQANMRRATTKLPLSLALDPKRAQSDDLCEFTASKTANCPRSSIIGRARAVSPLLRRPLTGPVYFAKNVRVNERGNAIRTLPSLVVALRGEVAVNLRANSDSKKGKLITTFPSIPDTPATRFELDLRGGRRGILQVTKTRSGGNVDICSKPQVADVELDGQNGRQRDFDLRMKTPCSAPQRKAAKRRARRSN